MILMARPPRSPIHRPGMAMLSSVGPLAGLAHTLTHEEMRAQVREITAQSYAFGEQWLRAVAKEGDLPMPADQLVRVLHALIEGLVFQRLLTPELGPDEIFRARNKGGQQVAYRLCSKSRLTFVAVRRFDLNGVSSLRFASSATCFGMGQPGYFPTSVFVLA